MKTHKLKTWPEYFIDVAERNKNFEIRENDRDFQVGDILLLQEYDPIEKIYTGRQCQRWVTFILSENPFLELGNKVIMSIR